MKQDSNFAKKYPNINIIMTGSKDDDVEGIKTVSLKLKHADAESPKFTNFTIKQFYLTNEFNKLSDIFTMNDLDMNINPDSLASEFDLNSIKIKHDSVILSQNPNLEIKAV